MYGLQLIKGALKLKSLINFVSFCSDQALSELLETCEIKFFCKIKQNQSCFFYPNKFYSFLPITYYTYIAANV